MDEPFSAVDPIVRERLQSEFLRLQETVRKTIVFVTHDIEEAVRLGDRIAVMSQGGKVEQFAAAGRAARRPRHARSSRTSSAPTAGSSGWRSPASTATTSSTRRWCTWPTGWPRRAPCWPGPAPGGPSCSTTGSTCTAGCRPSARPAARHGAATAGQRMEAWVPVDASLKTAFATMLQLEAGWVAVLDGDRFCGVLTPESLHAALRRSVEGSVPEVAGAGSARTRSRSGRGGASGRSSSSSPGGTRQTCSSQSAATVRAAPRTTPSTAVTVSPDAALSRPSAGAGVQQHAGPGTGEDRTHPGAGLGEDGRRATSSGSTGRAAVAGRAAGAAPPLALRRQPGGQRRAPSASASASTPSGTGSHQENGGSEP